MYCLCSDNCRAARCYEVMACPECRGSGVFIGAGIGGGSEPSYYGLQYPCKLPCRICNGEKVIVVYCQYYRR